ncbi:MAG: lytic transglycosylase domain-containing protein [Aquihabitans sp.]
MAIRSPTDRRTSVVGALTVLVIMLSGTPFPRSASAAGNAPMETPTIDTILDGIPVSETATLRRSTERFAAAQDDTDAATLRWISADVARLALVHQFDTAEGAVRVAAEAAKAAATEATVQLAELQRRTVITTAKRKALARQQVLLRRLAVGAFTSGVTDQFAYLSTFDQMSEPLRREAISGQVIDKQSGIVEAHTEVWQNAKDRQDAQRRRWNTAERSRKARNLALLTAIGKRDDLRQKLAAAIATLAERQAELDRSNRTRHRALVERRRLRLPRAVSGLDLSLVALHAYWRASEVAPCRIPWWVLAGVGRVESHHGTAQGSRVTATGDTTNWIRGVALDGHPGTLAIPDTDGGRYDADPVWERAVGPMQFIPGTWARWAVDADHDGAADPHNLYDAAAAAARYLCFSRGDLMTEGTIRGALLAYNRSVPYGTNVLSYGEGYRQALTELSDLPPEPR